MPDRSDACGIPGVGVTLTVDVTNNSDYEFVLDGDWLKTGVLKDRSAPIRAGSRGQVVVESTDIVQGVSGILWFVDSSSKSVYLSMALSKSKIGSTCFTCQAGVPPANLKALWNSVPKIEKTNAAKGCEWSPCDAGISLTILKELEMYVPLTATDYAPSEDSAAAAAAAGLDNKGAELAVDGGGYPQGEKQNASALFMTQTRPKDLSDGLVRGLKTVGTSLAGGAATAVAAPVVGAKQGGALGFAKGLGTGLLGGAALAVGGTVCGVAQMGRGVMQAPQAHRARQEEKVWDQELGKWVDVDLCALEREVEEMKTEAEAGSGGGSASSTTVAVADTEYYDLLKVGAGATPSEIKKAYYKEARQCHPDKNPGDEAATARFQQLSKVYQVLSDPEMRKKYDKEGKAALEEDQKAMQMDPTVFFSLLFGSERFLPWTGELNIAMQADHFVKASEKAEQEDADGFLPGDGAAAMHRRQLKREVQCAVHLREKLERAVYGRDPAGLEEQLKLEAHELAGAQFGGELLVALGEVYQIRAEIYLANELAGRFSFSKKMAGARHSSLRMRHALHFYKNAAGSLVQAKKLYSAASKAQDKMDKQESQATADAQDKGLLQDEASKEVQAAMDDALPTFLQTAWTYVVRDIDSTVKSVARKLLQDKSVPWQIRVRRAQALQSLGQIFVQEGNRHAAAAEGSSATRAAASGEAKDVLQEALMGSFREKEK